MSATGCSMDDAAQLVERAALDRPARPEQLARRGPLASRARRDRRVQWERRGPLLRELPERQAVKVLPGLKDQPGLWVRPAPSELPGRPLELAPSQQSVQVLRELLSTKRQFRPSSSTRPVRKAPFLFQQLRTLAT